MERDLLRDLSPDLKRDVETHLSRLLPHLKPGQFAVVGGLAIRFLLSEKGLSYNPDFNDIDMTVREMGVVLPSVGKDFLIYHHHLVGEREYFALVDPTTKMKVDIFPQAFPERYVQVNVGGQEIDIPTAEDQLVKTVYDVLRISDSDRVDPKQFKETDLLMQIADLAQADEIWKSRGFPNCPDSLTEAVKRAKEIAHEHPEYLQEKPFRKPQPYQCSECIKDPNFPLAPMEEVYKILGYIE